jgi:tetratricopeptide (TPR) repeat protein
MEKAPGVTKADLAPYTQPLRDKGTQFLKTCLDRAAEYRIRGSGVDACVQAARDTQVDVDHLGTAILVEPQWRVESADARPLLVVARQALKNRNIAEFNLALQLLSAPGTTLSVTEKAELSLMTGLAEWNIGENQAAVRVFRTVSDSSDSELASSRNAALKNLGALYLQVRDWEQAENVSSGMSTSDPEGGLIRGLALTAKGKYSDANTAFEEALSNAAGNTRSILLFNRAIVLAKLNRFRDAASMMSTYIESESPSGNHISRSLLRQWRTQK